MRERRAIARLENPLTPSAHERREGR
jgi:hypothetical protein